MQTAQKINRMNFNFVLKFISWFVLPVQNVNVRVLKRATVILKVHQFNDCCYRIR